jgi:hypothetical protein
MKKPYEAPKVFELGTVQGLTQGDPEDIDFKCQGSADFLDPNENSNRIEEEEADCFNGA